MRNDRKRLAVEVDEVLGVNAAIHWRDGLWRHDKTLRVALELRVWQAELLLVDVARLLGREKTQEVLEANL